MNDAQPTSITQDVVQHILQSYFHLADSLANLLGQCCEVVVHRLGELSCSVVKIVNGFHTGRSIGAPITDNALKILKNDQKALKQLEQIYFSTRNDGHLVKSTTPVILVGNGNPTGLLCMNLNLSYPLDKTMANLMPQQNLAIPSKDERFVAENLRLTKYALYKHLRQLKGE
ncbi:hypothetical protein BKG91_04165 [Rodentibacter caecimuris]|uniref:YheO-like domain-containing protein n=1 Tax=Rodentibacter caecimuris TaxID=1796644 RepID=A0AAJ3K250_9PAST|nr:PAS domain-containing protein [Rodentibacter heylii]AOF52750.1 YheO-like PAS domain [Pasteurellaceae bacterium NI1060]OOF70408.1 hypothetical protein BKG90_10090 [Rodentibacter heylii]OOF75124.1 hypothetical protein BKG91_04165 [Rodentibacter heylii]OOF78484.1 hypothetical protein BKG99_00480 [Rodentibacter heylii]